VACVFDQLAPFPGQGEEGSYAVAWRCPQCQARSLDICPLGPLVPTATTCLNCGADFPGEVGETSCPACGLPRGQARSYLGLDPAPADPVAAARQAFDQGLFRHGLALLNRALQQNPGLEQAWHGKRWILDRLGFTRARRSLLEGALAAGAPASLLISYGYTLQEAGDHRGAVAAYERYLGQEPAGPWAGVACCNQANSLAALGDADLAEALYRRAIAVEPTRATHYLNFVGLLVDQDRRDEALAFIEAGLEHATEPAHRIRLLEDQAFVLAEQERGEESLRSADAAAALDSDSARTHYLRGRALALLGRLEEARAEMQRVLALDPANADGRRALGMIDEALGPGSGGQGASGLLRRALGALGQAWGHRK
jgi:tetratricopeptide (TPR) repeat protein